MNDFNQNSPDISSQAYYSAEPSRKKQGLKALLFTLILGGVVAIGYFGYQNPNLFKADLVDKGLSKNIPASVKLYIPNYESGPVETGALALKLRDSAMLPGDEEKIVSVKFKLQYSPANTLTFNTNSLIFDNTTLFKSADLKSVNTTTKGEIIVSMFSNKPEELRGGLGDITLFKLGVDLKAAVGSKINLKVSEVEVIKKTANNTFENSKQFSQIGADKISITKTTTGELKLLYGEVIDPNRILLKFSDLLSDIGKASDYKIQYTDPKVKNTGGASDATINTDFYIPKDYEVLAGRPSEIYIYAGKDINAVSDFSIKLTAPANQLTFLGINSKGTIFENEPINTGTQLGSNILDLIVQGGQFKLKPSYNIKKGDLLMKVSVLTDGRLKENDTVSINYQSASITNAISKQSSSATFTKGQIKIITDQKQLVVNKILNGFQNTLCPSCDQSFVILETDAQLADVGYFLTIDPATTNIEGNLKGGLFKKAALGFFGYVKPDSKVSSVKLKSIDVKSETELILNFDGNIDPKTVTPINLLAGSFLAQHKLIFSKLELINGGTVRAITQNKQKSGLNYSVAFKGFKDPQGKKISNNLILNFTGYSSPKMSISQVKPNSIINNQDQSVVLIGENLNTITEARLGAQKVKFSNVSKGAVTLIIPKDFKKGSYDINLLSRDQQTQTLKNALIIDSAQSPFRIVATESKSVPKKVAPDGKTKVKLYALVEDKVDIASVSTVTIDLSPIGGSKAVAMAKDTGLQKKGQQLFVVETTVDVKTPTQAVPYQLKVQARKGSDTTDGVVEIVVTKDVLKSVAPVVEQIYVNPTTVAPDGKTPVKISAKITDADGADTIKSVIADMGKLGVGFIPLKPLNVSGKSTEQSTGFFESATFKVPTTTKGGKYKISVMASDDTGESAKSEIELSVSQSVTGPRFDKSKSYIGPRKSVPNDGKTTFNINVMVSDSDGVSDVDSVVAYFTSLGIRPVTLVKDPKTSDTSKSALFSSSNISIPTSAPIGNHQIQIVATDKAGGQGNITLVIDVTYQDTIGDAPIVFTKKSYSTPKVALNNGKTPITLYAFVRDDDQDLDSVIVNLKGVGQVGAESPAEFGAGGANNAKAGAGGSCPTGSNTIVCMNPSFREGRDGQWFVLPDVTISSRTPATNTPYQVEVIATDKARKVGRGKISILVTDGQNFVQDKKAPELMAAVPVAPGKIEAVFNEALLSTSISSVGREFTITKKSDVNQKLNVVGATTNVDGNIVTLTTSGQVADEDYVLTVSGIQDLSGVPIAPRSNKASFKGFTESRKGPVVHFVSATDQETIEIEFQEPIRPSSLQLGEATSSRGAKFNIKLFEAGKPSAMLPIKSVTLLEGGTLLQVKTEAQKSTQRYQMQINNISSASGNPLKRTINKFFKAINYRAVQIKRNATGADLNGDGKVDFIDFTLFSASYGKSFGSSSSTSAKTKQSLKPIKKKPNATVPITSNPQ